jgi:hypothetical protein
VKDSEDREPFEEACDDDSDPNDEDEDIDNVEADKVLSCCSSWVMARMASVSC